MEILLPPVRSKGRTLGTPTAELACLLDVIERNANVQLQLPFASRFTPIDSR